MGPAVFLMVCLWSCVGNVTPLSDGQVFAATQYISTKLIGKFNNQFAYVAVFSDDECNRLTWTGDGSTLNILSKENKAGIQSALENHKLVYKGEQMVLARPEFLDQCNIHSEYRLLFPEPNSQASNPPPSPVQKLLQKNPGASCVLFYSHYSPCVFRCAKIGHPDCILPQLTAFKEFDNKKKAFAYKQVYKMFAEENQIWDGLTAMNGYMEVFRCQGKNCVSCTDKNKETCLSQEVAII